MGQGVGEQRTQKQGGQRRADCGGLRETWGYFSKTGSMVSRTSCTACRNSGWSGSRAFRLVEQALHTLALEGRLRATATATHRASGPQTASLEKIAPSA